MTLAPGTRLGAYEIVALIGAGGMGEVYRARDTRLKRDVAVKVLPDAFANDVERLSRFQREAELLAALKRNPRFRTNLQMPNFCWACWSFSRASFER